MELLLAHFCSTKLTKRIYQKCYFNVRSQLLRGWAYRPLISWEQLQHLLWSSHRTHFWNVFFRCRISEPPKWRVVADDLRGQWVHRDPTLVKLWEMDLSWESELRDLQTDGRMTSQFWFLRRHVMKVFFSNGPSSSTCPLTSREAPHWSKTASIEAKQVLTNTGPRSAAWFLK